jgi:hypothetical protein
MRVCRFRDDGRGGEHGDQEALHHRRHCRPGEHPSGRGAAVLAYNGRPKRIATLAARIVRERQRLVQRVG